MLEQSIFIAKLLGPVLFIASIPMLINPKELQKITREFLRNHALMYITGVMVMLGGLSIVISHNIWVTAWPVIITLFGWAMVLGGALRVVLTSAVVSIGEKMLGNSLITRISGLVWAFIGVYLVYQGYF